MRRIKDPWRRPISAPSVQGYTLIEIMLVLALGAVVLFAVVKLVTPTATFFRKIHAHQQAFFEMNKCLNTIRRVLSKGQPGTVVISTASGAPPNSSIAFTTLEDGSLTASCTIQWSISPPNSVHLLRTLASNPPTDSVIAQNITGLSFATDFRDSAVIGVSIQVDEPIDGAGNVYTLMQPNETVRLVPGL